MQALERVRLGPEDLIIAWDQNDDEELDRREFMANVHALIEGQHKGLWEREVRDVVMQARTLTARTHQHSPQPGPTILTDPSL